MSVSVDKKRRLILAASCLSGFMAGVGSAGAAYAQNAAQRRVLTLYFTWSGSSEAVAREVHRILGGDIERIEALDSYPRQYEETTVRAKAERLAKARPAVKPLVHNPADYDVIVIGHPIWGGQMPMPVYTCLEKLRLENKVLLHFDTHGGSGLGNSQRELTRLFPRCVIKEGLALYGWGGVRDIGAVAEWLTRTGMTA